MPDTDAALMTAFLHRANPKHARNIIDRPTRPDCPDTWPLDHSFGRSRENA